MWVHGRNSKTVGCCLSMQEVVLGHNIVCSVIVLYNNICIYIYMSIMTYIYVHKYMWLLRLWFYWRWSPIACQTSLFFGLIIFHWNSLSTYQKQGFFSPRAANPKVLSSFLLVFLDLWRMVTLFIKRWNSKLWGIGNTILQCLSLPKTKRSCKRRMTSII